jgi:hypothetical protein
MARNNAAMRIAHRVSDFFALLVLGLHTRRCPQGCGVVIRFRVVSKTEGEQLTAVAADHAGRHRYPD